MTVLTIKKVRREDALAFDLRSDQLFCLYHNAMYAGLKLPEDLAAADVAIYPLDDNLVNRAKCPAKLTEIMLAGCPVVADRVGQAQEYIRHGENGLLTNPQFPEEMVQAVLSLLDDPTRDSSLGKNARASILSDFRWRDAAEQLQAFYQNCMKDS